MLLFKDAFPPLEYPYHDGHKTLFGIIDKQFWYDVCLLDCVWFLHIQN